jgi:hypothetical protein
MLAPEMAEAVDRSHRKWQTRLLPFMIRMVVVLAAFFFIASLAQLAYLHWSILYEPNPGIDWIGKFPEAGPNATLQDQLSAAQFRALVSLEREALLRRYHHVTVS